MPRGIGECCAVTRNPAEGKIKCAEMTKFCADMAFYPISYPCPGPRIPGFPLHEKASRSSAFPLCWLSALRLGRRTIRPYPDGHEIAPEVECALKPRARAPETRAANAVVGCLGVVVVWRAVISCERELACSCCAPQIPTLLPLASLSALSASVTLIIRHLAPNSAVLMCLCLSLMHLLLGKRPFSSGPNYLHISALHMPSKSRIFSDFIPTYLRSCLNGTCLFEIHETQGWFGYSNCRQGLLGLMALMAS